MKIKDIILFSNKCELYFDSGDTASIWQFGKSLYSTTSQDNLFKPLLKEVKNDILKYGFNDKFKSIWI